MIWFVIAILASLGVGKYVQMKHEITKKEKSIHKKDEELTNTKKELTETGNKLEQSKQQIKDLKNEETDKISVHIKGLQFIQNLLLKQGYVVELKIQGRSDYLEVSKQNSSQVRKLNVKALSNNAPVPFGSVSPNSLNVDYLVICRNLSSTPQIFTCTIEKASQVIHKDFNNNYWLQPKHYEKFDEGLEQIKF